MGISPRSRSRENRLAGAVAAALLAAVSDGAAALGQGRIAGTVRLVDGTPVVGAAVTVWQYHAVGSWLTDAEGRYGTDLLEVGDYRVSVAPLNGLYGVSYPHEACPPRSPDCGEVIVVLPDTVHDGIDFTLRPGGWLSGRALRPDGALFTGSFAVIAYDRHARKVADSGSVTPPTGLFEVGPLPPGRYTVQIAGLERLLYPGIPCGDVECDVRFGEPVEVVAGAVTENLEVRIPARTELRVVLRDAATQTPFSPRTVTLQVIDSRTGERIDHYATDEAVIGSLLPGRYYLVAQREGWVTEGLGGAHLPPSPGLETIARRTATVEIREGQPAAVTLELDREVRVKGRVLKADGSALGSCEVEVFDAEGTLLASEHGCSMLGTFELSLPPLPFRLLLHPAGPSGGTGVLHDGQPCSYDIFDTFETCDLEAAALLTPAAGDEIDLGDLRLPATGEITGLVPAGSLFSRVELYDLAGKRQRQREIFTNDLGVYGIHDILPGAYKALFRGAPGIGSEVYPGLDCQPAVCDPSRGLTLTVVAGERIQGIGFTPVPVPGGCTRGEGCLNEHRFRVAVRWRDPLGQVGEAHQQVSSRDRADTGFYWFFSRENTELLVKVLDACDQYGYFWVFAAGTTDVGVEIEVEHVTGQISPYERPLGLPFSPLFDFQPFACEGGATTPAPAPVLAPTMAVPVAAPSLAPPPNTSLCAVESPNRDYLCLLQNRFRVDATWQSFDGSEGRGLAYDNGSLYFFDPNNVEVMMKVLDGCALNGHYWVFSAGLTNVGVRLLVTDTYTDRQKVYENPLGHPFEPILDTAAFTCWRE